MTLKITVVRHGNTDANNEGWLQGQYDTVLNKNGLNQARKCGERLQNETYDHVYCSDLTRCKQTLDAILAHHKNVNIDYLESLRERGFGQLTKQSIKKVYVDANALKVDVDTYVHNHGGETSEVFRQRVNEAWEYIVKDALENQYESILVVSHGGVIRNFTNYWVSHGYKPVNKDLVVSFVPHGNTAVSVVDASTKVVHVFNSTSHLVNQQGVQPPPAV